jgi:hypothetical protein
MAITVTVTAADTSKTKNKWRLHKLDIKFTSGQTA